MDNIIHDPIEFFTVFIDSFVEAEDFEAAMRLKWIRALLLNGGGE